MITRTTVPVEDVTAESEKFYALRNGNKGPDGKIRFVVHGFAPCSEHDSQAAKCKSYESRPEACRVFPSLAVDEMGQIRERRGGLGSPFPSPPRFGS